MMRYPQAIPSRKAYAAFLFWTLIFCNTASASLIGDTLTIRRAFPDLTTDFAPPISIVVENGSADAVSGINPEANSILIDFSTSSSFVGSGDTFDGLAFTGFSDTIQSVTITRLPPFLSIVGPFDFGADYINLNLVGQFGSGDGITLELDLIPTPVPAPGALLLFGSGLIGLLGFKGYMQKQQRKHM